MLVDWLAVQTLTHFKKTFSVQHSVPHDRPLFHGVNGQFVVSLVRVTAATDEIVRTGHSLYGNHRTLQATEPTQEAQRPWYRYNPLTMAVSLAQDILVAFRMPFLTSTYVWWINGGSVVVALHLCRINVTNQHLRVGFSRSNYFDESIRVCPRPVNPNV